MNDIPFKCSWVTSYLEVACIPMKICVWGDRSVSIRESSASLGQMTTRASSTRLGNLSPCHSEL